MGDTIETEIVDLLRAMRDEPRNMRWLRKRIADVILQVLPELERRGTYWAKLHLVHACRAFDHNARTSARDASRDTWLTYCLLQLQDALLPKGAYDENYAPRERDIDRLTFEELRRLVRCEFEPLAA